MKRTTQTTYRYRLDPTDEQAKLLFQFAGARRFIWNWAVKRKQDYYHKTGKTLGFSHLCKELTILKRQPATAWLRQIDSQLLQQALRDLENAFQHFFRRLRNGERKKGFPKFKSRKTDTPRFRIPQRVVLEDAFVLVPKIGLIKTIVHRPLEAVTKSATFKREACGHWYISLVVEQQNSHLIAIGRWFPSSKICSACGSVNADLTLAEREWRCSCGVRHDRDLNAAGNIDREGLRLFRQTIAVGYTEMQNACGDPVGPIDRVGAGR